VQPVSGKIALSVLWGCLLGFLGTFVVMLVLSGFLDVIFPAGPGPGAMVFYLSLGLSPLAGVVGGLYGMRYAIRHQK
jgi:hypothetical protein